ncbi:unnamed protein product (macronuclear) [Paramecium tetraurelia]|uniref:Chromosome undetermined scaffold_1, whole genome shotgun sequence n=1 Tax=Paramecium tetraurelia TaxID=5888 RepID=Q6BG66_PARTE|nr:hypothetical protein [Paramecium tetraurelia strain d4-2]XP_001423337.1 uncharacterized protein GSPATT00000374001 [Paramecium tetraurelia]CAH03354.1 hypothetical protein PTMB.156c [Paramecium tetraurelia]CAK55939.1 unnamed protein product [Paramecium tetraurelia]|eukprot:XP_001423337.1 hypothetical protein (macronuclear) [Paramecium tetraurelia strain d4-2]
MNFLSLIDLFGVELRQQISLNVKSQKSKLGGIISLFILAASLGYLAYIMNEWISFRLLPKSTNTMKANLASELQYDEDQKLFEFFYWKYQDQQIDPFNQQNNILTPLGINFENGFPSAIFSFLSQNESISYYGTKKFGLNQFTLSQNSNGSSLENVRELMLVLVRCEKKYLTGNQSCASEEEIDNFFDSAVNFIAFQIHLQQFNSETQEFEFIKKSYYFSIDKVISSQSQVFLKQTQAYIDNGVLLGSIEQETFVQDANILTTSASINFWQKILGMDTYLNMIFRLDPVSQELKIVYPKLGEVLAQVGSIANILLLLRYVILYYNEKLLEYNFIDQVLSFYFTDYQQIKNSKVNYDKKACAVLVEQAQKRLVYINIIYELSRIQLFLQYHFGRKKLQESHSMGILLKPPNKNLNQDLEQALAQCQEENLDDENQTFHIKDFFLLSQPKNKQKQVEEQSVRQYDPIAAQQINSQIK